MAALRSCRLRSFEFGRNWVGIQAVVNLVVFLSVVAADPASDKLVLQAFKAGITNSDILGWTASDPCAWAGPSGVPGVQCDSAGNVQMLRVRELGLTGTVTPELHQLASLTYLELNLNNFTGAMPTLAGLSKLTQANLGNNEFTSIPADFFDGLTSIVGLYINDNPNLNASTGGWTMPPAMTDAAPTLTTFYMDNVSATGALPAYLGAMPALQTLRMGYNKFSGGVPSSFAKLSGMQELRLNNQALGGFTGSVEFIGTMTGLTLLYLHANSFTGPVPAGITNAVGMQDLRLSNNLLVGRLPLALGSLRALKFLWLNNGNQFSGELPVLATGLYDRVDTTTFCAAPGVACSTQVNSLLDFLAAVGYPQTIAASWVGGDPCTSWSGVTCVVATKDVTSLVLSKAGLAGSISPSLANLTSLETLTLSGNALTGVIPAELTKITTLKTVDVSDNNLSPPLPSFPASVTFKYSGNALLVATPPGTPPSPIAPVSAPPQQVDSPIVAPAPSSSIVPTPPPGIISSPVPTSVPNESTSSKKSSSSILPAAVGGAVGGSALCIILLVLCVCYKRKVARNAASTKNRDHDVHSTAFPSATAAPEMVNIVVHNSSSSNGNYNQDGQGVEAWNMTFTIDELRTVTNNFAECNILGRGGFGVVYKGILPDGTKIAVKRMEAAVVSSKGLSEFRSEIKVLTKVKHRHLVGLLGYCTDGVERLLVYEYMSQGTLAQHLFKYEEMNVKPLSWTKRVTIALDVAQAVEYLHGLAHRSFIHRDLKPSNVLLNDDFRAKVSDFGLVKLAPEGALHSVETRLAGTFGYLAPEYAVTGRVTTKADVFSFGVVLMELLTGRRAVDETQEEQDMYLVTWFTNKLRSKQETPLRSALDPNILRTLSELGVENNIDDEEATVTWKSIVTVAELAGHCTTREPSQRPDMGHVVSVLRPLVDEWKPMEAEEFGGEEDHNSMRDMSLSTALRKWQEFRDESVTTSTSVATDTSSTSLPTRPGGFAESFTSWDGR